jgi:hypothetical protein
MYKSRDKKYCTVQKKIVQSSFIQYSLADRTVQFIYIPYTSPYFDTYY